MVNVCSTVLEEPRKLVLLLSTNGRDMDKQASLLTICFYRKLGLRFQSGLYIAYYTIWFIVTWDVRTSIQVVIMFSIVFLENMLIHLEHTGKKGVIICPISVKKVNFKAKFGRARHSLEFFISPIYALMIKGKLNIY